MFTDQPVEHVAHLAGSVRPHSKVAVDHAADVGQQAGDFAEDRSIGRANHTQSIGGTDGEARAVLGDDARADRDARIAVPTGADEIAAHQHIGRVQHLDGDGRNAAKEIARRPADADLFGTLGHQPVDHVTQLAVPIRAHAKVTIEHLADVGADAGKLAEDRSIRRANHVERRGTQHQTARSLRQNARADRQARVAGAIGPDVIRRHLNIGGVEHLDCNRRDATKEVPRRPAEIDVAGILNLHSIDSSTQGSAAVRVDSHQAVGHLHRLRVAQDCRLRRIEDAGEAGDTDGQAIDLVRYQPGRAVEQAGVAVGSRADKVGANFNVRRISDADAVREIGGDDVSIR